MSGIQPSFPLSLELSFSILQKLGSENLKELTKTCQNTKQIDIFQSLSTIKYDENMANQVIDMQSDLVVDKDLSITGELLIRAKHIYGMPEVCLSAKKVTFVAEKIIYLGSIEAQQFDKYSDASYVKGPMPDGSCYSYNSVIWPSLVKQTLG